MGKSKQFEDKDILKEFKEFKRQKEEERYNDFLRKRSTKRLYEKYSEEVFEDINKILHS